MYRAILAGMFCFMAGCTATGGGGGNGGGNDNGGDGGTTVEVSIANLAFDPADITVNVGTTVRWTNNENGQVRHTVTSGNPGDADAGSVFDPSLTPGQSFSFTFDEPGTYTYFCRIHSTTMRDATVTVEAP